MLISYVRLDHMLHSINYGTQFIHDTCTCIIYITEKWEEVGDMWLNITKTKQGSRQ